jgi:hypothetical protein
MTQLRTPPGDALNELFPPDPLEPYLEWIMGAHALAVLVAALCYLAFAVLIVFRTRLPGRLVFAAGNVLVLASGLWQIWQYRQLKLVGLSESVLVRSATSLGAALVCVGLLMSAIALVRQRNQVRANAASVIADA